MHGWSRSLLRYWIHGRGRTGRHRGIALEKTKKKRAEIGRKGTRTTWGMAWRGRKYPWKIPWPLACHDQTPLPRMIRAAKQEVFRSSFKNKNTVKLFNNLGFSLLFNYTVNTEYTPGLISFLGDLVVMNIKSTPWLCLRRLCMGSMLNTEWSFNYGRLITLTTLINE